MIGKIINKIIIKIIKILVKIIKINNYQQSKNLSNNNK
jgi:hypothetical protein